MKLAIISSVGALLLLSVPSTANAEAFNTCRGYINSLPTTISQQGTWCLSKDLTTLLSSGVAIEIAVNNVTIDCNNFKIGGQAGGAATTMVGISSRNILNTTIRNCTIRGFQTGIDVRGVHSSGHLLEHNRVDAATVVGIRLSGTGSVARDNVVSDTGGSPTAPMIAGFVVGEGVDVRDNLVDGVLPGAADATGVGIYSHATGGVIRENRVRNVVGAGAGPAYGIYVEGSGLRRVVGNDLFGTGALNTWGVLCAVQDAASLSDTYMGAFNVGHKACSNDGGNVSR